MAIVLLIVIYLIFISLGLPDSILGSSFPAIANNLQIREDLAGYVGLVVSGCTILSSLLSDKMIKKFSEKIVVSISILLTASGLVLFSLTTKAMYWTFFLDAILLGLGAGAIDSALNNYVALHYSAIHMNWLHCSWGIGASISPLIIASFIDSNNNSIGWNKGVLVIAIIQLCIALLSFMCIPLWKKAFPNEKIKVKEEKKQEESKLVSGDNIFKNPVFYLAMLGFFCYCGLETTTGNWAGFFFSQGKGFTTQQAARLDSMFFIGITIGRFICGPLSLKIKEKNMIRLGETILLLGTILSMLPFSNVVSIIGFALIGLGCAPIYPAIIRSTPYRFSKTFSQHAMGLEMAIAYCGNLVLSPLYGFFARMTNHFEFLPCLDMVLCAIMIFAHEILNIKLKKRDMNLSSFEKEEYGITE